MTQLIATGTAQADSADFTLTTDSTTLSLFSTTEQIPSLCTAMVQKKSASGVYLNFGQIDGNNPVKVLSGPGTYRVRKLASSASFGVDRD